MIHLDKNEIYFPKPSLYDFEGGLIAMGGDLSPDRIWLAYQLGIFPWFNPEDDILWWCPDPRFVLFPVDLKISKSMRKIIKDQKFTITENVCFETVMKYCSKIQRDKQDGTWITDEMIKSYTWLHKQGKAKSVEVWENSELVGGLYGIDLEHIFCGESMFSKVSNASKTGFIWFVEKYRNKYQLIDCQIYSEHLETLGAKNISKKEFLEIIDSHLSDKNL